MPRFPIESYLVPPDSPAPDPSLTSVVSTLPTGLPQTIQLDRDVSLVLLVPSGLAVTWRDADPSALVSTSADELSPGARDPAAPVGAVDRAAPRIVVQRSGTTVASLPLVARARRSVPDSGEEGELLELAVLGWEIHAGTLIGPGDFGSRVELAWRRADRSATTFAPPPTNPQLLRRLGREQRLESES